MRNHIKLAGVGLLSIGVIGGVFAWCCWKFKHPVPPVSPWSISQISNEEAFADASALALAQAASNGDVKTIERLVAAGVDVNSHGLFGITPLFRSIISKNKEGFVALLEHGADPNIRHARGVAVIHEAAAAPESFWLEQVRSKHSGDPNLIDAGNPYSANNGPLLYAIRKGSRENVELLIRSGANVNVLDGNSNTPLTISAMTHRFDAMYELLLAGAVDKDRWLYNRVTSINEEIVSSEQKPWFRRVRALLIESKKV